MALVIVKPAKVADQPIVALEDAKGVTAMGNVRSVREAVKTKKVSLFPKKLLLSPSENIGNYKFTIRTGKR